MFRLVAIVLSVTVALAADPYGVVDKPYKPPPNYRPPVPDYRPEPVKYPPPVPDYLPEPVKYPPPVPDYLPEPVKYPPPPVPDYGQEPDYKPPPTYNKEPQYGPVPEKKPSYKPIENCPEPGEKYLLCGHVGVSEKICEKDENCCYNRKHNKCYFKRDPCLEPCCELHKKYRCACSKDPKSELNFDPYECRLQGCCYDSNQKDSDARCYQSREDCCDNLSKKSNFVRVDAGFSGIKKAKCLEWPNSCWNVKPKTAYCFYKYTPSHCRDVPTYNRLRKFGKGGVSLEKEPAVCRSMGYCFDSRNGLEPRCFTQVAYPYKIHQYDQKNSY